MEKDIEQLLKILRVLTDLHDILIKIGERKRDALIQSDMQSLQAAVQEQEKVAGKIHQVEQERLRTVGLLFQRHLPGERVIRIETLCAHAPESLRAELEQSRRKLRKRVESLRKVNEVNKSLCEQGLSTITYYLQVLTSALTENNKRYDMLARVSEPKHYNLLDQTG